MDGYQLLAFFFFSLALEVGWFFGGGPGHRVEDGTVLKAPQVEFAQRTVYTDCGP